MESVIIAGGGPTGLMLACELSLAGVDVLVLERLAEGIQESRAGGIHARTMEVFDQRGILTDAFVADGRKMNVAHFSALWLDISKLATRYPFLLNVLQARVERHLGEWASELGVRIERDAEVIGLTQDDEGVEVELRGGRVVRTEWLVGCDGGRSLVRRAAAIDFPGTPATMTALLADVELTDPPEERIFQERREHGSFSLLDFGTDWWRVMTNEYDHVSDRAAEVDLEDVRTAMIKIAGKDYGMRNARWVSRFSDAARQAAEYRRGRVLLAGDAAHIHFPAGGQGLNTGVQDAVNLGWKLAAVVRGEAPATLLDTYGSERHAVGERVLNNTRAQTILGAPGDHMTALRETMAGLIELPEVNEKLASMLTAIDVRYDMGEGHPLLGLRVPDVDIESDDANRVSELLHGGRPVLLDLRTNEALLDTAAPWMDRIELIPATTKTDRWALPVGGEIDAPEALLIRPDGHVAWVATDGEVDLDALTEALTRWCGPARRA